MITFSPLPKPPERRKKNKTKINSRKKSYIIRNQISRVVIRTRAYHYHEFGHVVHAQRVNVVVDFAVDDGKRDLIHRDGGITEMEHQVDDEDQPKTFPVLHGFRVEFQVRIRSRHYNAQELYTNVKNKTRYQN